MPTDKQKTLKEKLERLSEIAKLMENDELELEKALDLYTESVKLADECRKQLEEAKQVIEKLSLKDDNDE